MRRNFWWIVFLGVFAFGLLIIAIFCNFKDGYTFRSIQLADWLNYFAACGTIGGFLYLIVDKIQTEKEESHIKWQSEIPFLTLTSPCDPTSNVCDINILTFETDYQERGYGYFSICNLGKTNAYDIKILFYTKDVFIDSNIFRRHYVPYLQPLQVLPTPGYIYYANREFVYSNFSVNPDTKEITTSTFEICGCLESCQISTTNANEKYFFGKLEYFSTFAKGSRYRIESTLRIDVNCITEDSGQKSVRIKGITFIDYDYQRI